MIKMFRAQNEYTLGYLLNIVATVQRCDCAGASGDDVCADCEINGGDLVEEVLAAINALKGQTK